MKNLVVDHEYQVKNLFFITKYVEVRGVSCNGIFAFWFISFPFNGWD